RVTRPPRSTLLPYTTLFRSQASPTALTAVAWVGALTALFGAIVATRQFDIKRVLAYSTMSQLGYMMLGAGVGAYTQSLFHFFTRSEEHTSELQSREKLVCRL